MQEIYLLILGPLGIKVSKWREFREFLKIHPSKEFYLRAEDFLALGQQNTFRKVSLIAQYISTKDGQASLESGDFFTTWANRFDSDMPSTKTVGLEDDEIFILGNTQVCTIPLPGHSNDSVGYYIPSKDMIVCGAILPRADRPSRCGLANRMSNRFTFKCEIN